MTFDDLTPVTGHPDRRWITEHLDRPYRGRFGSLFVRRHNSGRLTLWRASFPTGGERLGDLPASGDLVAAAQRILDELVTRS